MFFFFSKTKGPKSGGLFLKRGKKGETCVLGFAGKSGLEKNINIFSQMVVKHVHFPWDRLHKKSQKKNKSKGSGKDLVVLLAFSFGFFTVRVFSAKPSFRCADRNLDGVALNYIPPENNQLIANRLAKCMAIKSQASP